MNTKDKTMKAVSHLPRVPVPRCATVQELIKAYGAIDERILTVQAVEAVVPDMAYIKSLLSRKGPNRHLLIEARKQGTELRWWSDYYARCEHRLGESLRSMERRIAEYCANPPLPAGMFRDFAGGAFSANYVVRERNDYDGSPGYYGVWKRGGQLDPPPVAKRGSEQEAVAWVMERESADAGKANAA